MNEQPIKPTTTGQRGIRERGAAGKALIVYLASGSVLAAGAAYLIFSGMGC